LIDVNPAPQQIHVLTTCDSVLPGGPGDGGFTGLRCQPEVTHANGTLVTANAPAQMGEELVAYAVGLGAVSPPAPTAQAASAPAQLVRPLALDFNYRPNALPTQPAPSGPAPVFAGLASGYAGLYQINFTVPVSAPSTVLSCGTQVLPAGVYAVQSYLTVSFGEQASFDGGGICMAVPAS
jgi:uncharacterized protein (TIGR03437 family)